MGVTQIQRNRMELEDLVKELKNEVELKEDILKTFTDDMKKTYEVVQKIERPIRTRTEDYEQKLSRKTLEINAKEREIEKLNDKIDALKANLDSVKSAKMELEINERALENKLTAKNVDIDTMNKKLVSMKKKVDFKSSLE